MEKWPAGTRFFEVQKDKRSVIDELIAKGDIEDLCGSETQDGLCIATDGCAPTLAEAKQFIARYDREWFDLGEDLWWLREISENDAWSFYGMDYSPDRNIFTESDQFCFLREYAVFLDSDYAWPVTVASGLSHQRAAAIVCATEAPGCGKFVMVERDFHNAKEDNLFDLLRKKRRNWQRDGEIVSTGTLRELMARMKDHAINEVEYWLIAPHKEAADNA